MDTVPERQQAYRPQWAIGLMSGTSLDGIDVSLVRTDGEQVFEYGPTLLLPYPDAFRERLRTLLGRDPQPSWQPMINDLTDMHAEAVRKLLINFGLPAAAVDVIGFHGQTIWHRPERRQTLQIGDGQRLATTLGIDVVTDFRKADVAAGGQGAPLVPLYHSALAAGQEGPLAVLNIGGVTNITWIGDEGANPTVIAFDLGPGNALIDDWVLARTGRAYDADGQLAASGIVDGARVMNWLRHDYFRRPWPKSLDREAFRFALDAVRPMRVEDGAATLTAFTARAVAFALPLLPAAPRRWLVCGGGRRNATLMSMLADGVGAPVEPIEAIGRRGDFIEAEAFGFLAVRVLRRLPLTLPTTTGVPEPLTGGRVYHAVPGDQR
jgi:anhydro-N-acetylmuramic acid kinase